MPGDCLGTWQILPDAQVWKTSSDLMGEAI
jgi:hypothetical protein